MLAVLTYRANRDGTLVALYLGACRVGYATSQGARSPGTWLWHLTLVRPEGGAYAGRQPSLEAAQAAAARAVGEWVAAAGLCPVALPTEERTETAPSAPAKKGPIRPKRLL